MHNLHIGECLSDACRCTNTLCLNRVCDMIIYVIHSIENIHVLYTWTDFSRPFMTVYEVLFIVIYCDLRDN